MLGKLPVYKLQECIVNNTVIKTYISIFRDVLKKYAQHNKSDNPQQVG